MEKIIRSVQTLILEIAVPINLCSAFFEDLYYIASTILQYI